MESLSGPANMAADEAMLQMAAETGEASLRFYTWAEPTLSLGYFQPASVRLERYAKIPWVRRSTGGAALVHHHELTYALALPPGKLWQPVGESWLCKMHHIIAAVLAKLGAKAEPVVCGREQKLGEFLCFQHQTAGDLVSLGSKIVGSAQRKSKGALLQHGGILLRQSEFTPELPALFEQTGLIAEPQELAQHITKELAQTEHFQMLPSDWSPEEQELRQQIETEKYCAVSWNEKR
jgi:lipoyl(octanoyl) transferase